MSTLMSRYRQIRSNVEITDVGFFTLRVVALAGTAGWILVAPEPRETAAVFLRIDGFFVAYGLLIYALLFFRFDRKREIYRLSFLFDLAFVYLLVTHSGGFGSSFFIGFYLLTALHAFYYGHRTGLAVAALCTVVYLLAGLRISPLDPIDFSLRTSLMFLIAIPIGLFSMILRKDKERIDSLNKDLLLSVDTMKLLQGRLLKAERLSVLGRVTADVAHEIRNPLTAIGGFAKRIEKSLSGNPLERKYAGIIVSEVARLERILRDTLTLARATRFHLQHMDVNGILGRTEAKFAGVCAEKGIHIAVRPERELPSCVVDPDQIQQVLDNLVSNAVDAMAGKAGTVTLSTRTACEHGVGYIVIDVADTGPGVPEGIVERIFEPFFSTKEAGYGTGLGLSICKKIMEEHRGAIRVSPAPGGGSIFSLLIPHLPQEETFEAQCWEVTRCGVEKIGDSAERCPAYPNFGRICWAVAGTFCETNTRGVVARKIGDCRKCPFYRMIQPSCPGTGLAAMNDFVPQIRKEETS